MANGKFWILDRAISFVSGKFDGRKSTIAGLLTVGYGVVGFLGMLIPNSPVPLPVMGSEEAFGSITAGLAILGIAGKLEKGKKATEAQTEVLKKNGG